jgi:hypothetical protein
MDRFLIETPHKPQDCLNILDLVNAHGYLAHFDWGCMAGVHTGWAIIEAENDAQARMAVPPLLRGQALVTRLNKFDAASLAKMHQG